MTEETALVESREREDRLVEEVITADGTTL
jgi:hypothetical protein